MPRPPVSAASIVLLLLVIACTVEPPFARTNPLDAASNYDVTLSGPDSTHSLGERVTLVMQSDPPLPDDDYAISWVAGPYILGRDTTQVAASVGDGVFEVYDVHAQYRAIYLSVYFGRRVFSHRLVIGQKAASLELSCSPWSMPFDPCDDEPFVYADTVVLHTRMLDARQSPIVRKVGYALERGSVVSRDSSIVTPWPMSAEESGIIRLKPLRAGAAWVVVQIDEATDSVRIVVEP